MRFLNFEFLGQGGLLRFFDSSPAETIFSRLYRASRPFSVRSMFIPAAAVSRLRHPSRQIAFPPPRPEAGMRGKSIVPTWCLRTVF
jgi:hypothetical protein